MYEIVIGCLTAVIISAIGGYVVVAIKKADNDKKLQTEAQNNEFKLQKAFYEYKGQMAAYGYPAQEQSGESAGMIEGLISSFMPHLGQYLPQILENPQMRESIFKALGVDGSSFLGTSKTDDNQLAITESQ